MKSLSTDKPIYWDDKLNLGIPQIDKQHLNFFIIFDEVTFAIKAGNKQNECGIIIQKLIDYAKYHFKEEELLMTKANYEHLKEHIKEHRFFEMRLNEFEIAYNYNNPNLPNELLKFIRKWFLSHITNTDRLYVETVMECIRKKQC